MVYVLCNKNMNATSLYFLLLFTLGSCFGIILVDQVVLLSVFNAMKKTIANISVDL